MSGNYLVIDFTNTRDAATNATWMDKLDLSAQGLGWDGQTDTSRDGWIRTRAIPIGLSWRPTQGANIRVTIEPPPRDFTLANGQISTPYVGSAYARYSADGEHWSDWQLLSHEQAPPFTRPTTQPTSQRRIFSGQIAVPQIERKEYCEYLGQYIQLDVPWKSDEQAAVRWIIEKDPTFFQKHKPFVGYVQVLFEAGFYGQQRISSLKIDISWGVGGMHQPPKDETLKRYRTDTPWQFPSATPTTQPTR